MNELLATPAGEGPVVIRVPHASGGDFVATFRRPDCDPGGNYDLSSYVDTNGNRVEIAMMSPAYKAFIERIVDY